MYTRTHEPAAGVPGGLILGSAPPKKENCTPLRQKQCLYILTMRNNESFNSLMEPKMTWCLRGFDGRYYVSGTLLAWPISALALEVVQGGFPGNFRLRW